MTCPVCGTPTVPEARFCFHCGAALPVSSGEAETERRVVTVLFGDLSDFTSWAEDLDPERVGGVTDRVLASLAQIVQEFGGHVDKLTGDGIMAVFGAPTAHEDDPERAVRAAERMQGVVRRLVEQESGGGRRLGLRVGLNTGEVLAGVQAHLSYTVIGDAVNTAARLSDAAGVGAVLAGRDTAVSTMSTVSWRALAPLRLKGKREPVAAYELVALRAPGTSRLGMGDEAPFLGRDAEFGVLVGRLLEAVDARSPRTVLVVGEAGVGKTRLGQELTRFAGELPDARVLWGRCPPYGLGRDLAAVAELVRTACGVIESDDTETVRERVNRTAARLQIPDSAGQLRALLGVEEPTAGFREAATPGAAAGASPLRAAVAGLLSALAEQGSLVLVVDDLQWATPGLLAGLLEIAEQLRGRVLLLVLGRLDGVLAGALPPAWEHRLPAAELLVLDPLGESASERLLRAYLGGPSGALEDGVRDALLGRAQGNPFFLAELLHLLVDRGALQRAQDRWVLSGSVPEALPAGVQAVLAARIDGLDGPAKGVLRDASVIGLAVPLAALEAVGRASGHGQPEVVRRALGVLVERRLLEPTDVPDRWRFAHTLVRDVAYAGLAKVERARRHAAAAQHALSTPARGTETDLFAATQGERAVRLAAEMTLPPDDPAWQARGIAYSALARLGQVALSRDDAVAAEAVLTRALALSDAPGDPLPADLLLPVRVGRAQALTALHRLAEAEAELAGALVAPEQGLRAAALSVLGELRRKRGDTEGAREAFVRALSDAGAAGVERLSGEALRQLGLLDYFDGRLKAAELRFRQAHRLAVQVRDARGAGWALQHLAWSATTRGDYDLADGVLQDAAEVFSALEDTGGLSWVAGTEGFVRLLQGRLAEARELAWSVLPQGEGLGDRWGVAALLVIDAMAATELGDIAVAAHEAERSRAQFAEVGDRWGQALAVTALGVAARGADRPDRAVALLDDAARLAGSRHPVVAGLALVAGGYACLDRGDLSGAEDRAARSSAVFGRLDLEPHAALGGQVLLAQVLRRRGQLPEALATLDAALSGARFPGLLFPRRQALAHRAGTLLELGLREQALDAAREAVATHAEDVRSRVLALRALGSALRACGQPAQALAALREALEIARSTGQRSEVAATERLLEP